jgi:hypothetical protein
MTIRSFACHDGVSTPQISNPRQSAKCRFRRKLVILYLALLLSNLACGRTKFRGRSGD